MIKTINITLTLVTSLFLFSCSSTTEKEKENSDKGSFLDATLGKCINFSVKIYGDNEDFGVLKTRIDESDIVKLAIEKKYENEIKYISSISIRANGKEEHCTCYHNENGDIINKDMYQKK